MQRRTFVEQGFCSAAASSLLGQPAVAAADDAVPGTIRMVGQPKSDRGRDFFALALAKLALAQQGLSPEFSLSGEMTWPRQVRELHVGQMDLAVLPAVQGAYADFQMLRVNFPLRRGLLGIRLLLARRDRAKAIGAALSSMAALKRLRIGYGADWADRTWMERAGLQLTLRRTFVELFDALRVGECDVLSRGISEVWWELKRPDLDGQHMAVVPGVALFYPLDDCFYVNQSQRGFHRQLDVGLRTAVQNGRYLALLNQYYEDDLARAQLGRRRVFTLPDYPVPEGLDRHEYDVVQLLQANKAKR